MIGDMLSRVGIVAATSGGSMAVVALSPEHADLVYQMGVGVAAVVGAIAWIDRRIQRNRREADRVNRLQHRRIVEMLRAEIRALREALALAGVVPDLTPDPVTLTAQDFDDDEE